ncbi:MAG: outer membrane protein transport protein [Acidobacteriota bacterium]|nr:outer membrane protein transport protein [Acidobacteriota bacterium]
MKKSILLALVVLVSVPMAFPSIVTNTNQSIGFYRLLARYASLDTDAVYYNPAGLTKLSDGFHLALNNQTINQNKTIINGLPLLNGYDADLGGAEYVGKVRVPFFPTFYAVYKKGPLAVSFGFNPIGGGGSADYASGLPSFEAGYAKLPTLIYSATGGMIAVNGYSADISFNGSSIYYGFQLNISYAINDMFSVAGGLRYVSASNTYEGSLSNVMVSPYFPAFGWDGVTMIKASTVFTALGQTAYAAATGDLSVDAAQKGSGFTPVLSFMATPIEGLVLTIRYEFNTKLELTNSTTTDDTKGILSADGMFPDGAKTRADIPATLAFGASYAILPQLRVHASLNTDFDKQANWNGREAYIDKNTLEWALGVEYDVLENVTVSAGYLNSSYGVKDEFQSDMDFTLSASTIGAGAKWRLSDSLSVEAGLISVNYKDYDKLITYYWDALETLPIGAFKETYKQTTFGFGFAVNYSFR